LKDGAAFSDMSRLFIYYNERVIEHTVNEDSGAMIRDGIKTLAKQGVCPESMWPYNISKFKNKPAPKCYAEGLKHQILAYYRINTLQELKTSIAAGFPVTFGFSVYESFMTDRVAKTGIVYMPKWYEQLMGGHAVLAVGYDDNMKIQKNKGAVIVRNSWGTSWGDKGYFYMPYPYINDRNLSDDFWQITKQEE
jgi:C1A family cysteine protease